MTDRTMLQFFKYNLILEALLAESTERKRSSWKAGWTS
mgnify:CR=1 FL=1